VRRAQVKIMVQVLLCSFLVLCSSIPLFSQENALPAVAPPSPEPPSLCINGIIFGEQNPLAVINGDSFRKDDVIEGARIVRIDESSVTFEFKGAVFSKALGEGCGTAKAATYALEKTIEEATRQIQSNIVLPKQKTIPKQLKFNSKTMTTEEMATLGVVLFFFFLAYAYSALTLQLVAKKTGTANAWLAWVPVGNIFLMCMVAHRPLWWALLLLILPFTIIGILPAIIMAVVVLMDIAAACGKPKWLAFLTVIPFINSIGWIFFWGYLAFSKMPEPADTAVEHALDGKPQPGQSIQPPSPAPPEKAPVDKQDTEQHNDTSEGEPPVYNG